MKQAKSPSRVIKIPDFRGRLPKRSLYVYLPPGYDDDPGRHFPVLYMHDGQNCFEAFVGDSYAGSWRADQTADQLIKDKEMRPCVIVGVSNGGKQRKAEYLPPNATIQPRLSNIPVPLTLATHGRADQTLAYYQGDVDPYIRRHYRILKGRENIATCGSSMGGLFSTYIAWEHPEFARNHAILSPSYWMTANWRGVLTTIERLGKEKPRDIRIWLDSGTQDVPGRGDDGMKETIAARDALLTNGYQIGPDFQYYLDEVGIHNESSWAARLDRVFRFLFPPVQETPAKSSEKLVKKRV